MDQKGLLNLALFNLGTGIPKWVEESRNKCIDDHVWNSGLVLFYLTFLLSNQPLFHQTPGCSLSSTDSIQS